MPGQTARLDFPFESRGIVVQQQIRGIVVQQGTLLGKVEVFDNETGRTQFVLPGTTVGGRSPHM